MALRIAVVGLGKIAHDQHLPAIAASPDFELVAAASPDGALRDKPSYRSVEAMLSDCEGLEAIAMCQPPQVRFEAAWHAIEAGKHVLLEKPPGATLGEVRLLANRAAARGVTLFASWHSRYAPAVETARAWLNGRTVHGVEIEWREDVRRWHPGQAWIWQPGGLGVFDPGINALSIATHILPPFRLQGATLSIPANRAAPIAADLAFALTTDAPVRAAFDWRHDGAELWDIRVDTDCGRLVLSGGGKMLCIDGVPQRVATEREYGALYDRFAALVASRASDVDTTPLRHVADAFLRGEHRTVAPFED